MAGTITAIEVQKRNKERASIYLDGEFAFGVALIEAARLHKGQVLSDDEIAALKDQDTRDSAFDRAIRFLGYRPRSIHEVRQNLAQKKIEPPVIDSVIERLESLGYVDDLAFARYWVGNRDEFRPKGPLALRHELRQKGVPKNIIDRALEDVDFADAAYRAAEKQATRFKDLDRYSAKQKLYEFLARRGFTSGTIGDTLDQLLDTLDLPEPDFPDEYGYPEE